MVRVHANGLDWVPGGVSGGDPTGAAALAGAETVGGLVSVALAALGAGVRQRGGPLPAGGPAAVARAIAPLDPLPVAGVGAEVAIAELSALLAAGSADPVDPWCAAHLHCPPLAVAAAADLVASVLNPSMDSWDQAPAASALERALTDRVARLCYPSAERPDALVTSGGTESNITALLLARETLGPDIVPVCGANAHHSVARAAWLLGLPRPVVVRAHLDRVDPRALAEALSELDRPAVVTATAGTTNSGAIDPITDIADIAQAAGAWLHVDAAYGGALLFSDRRHMLAGIDRADSIALDLHKLGWQPIAAGVLVCRDTALTARLSTNADYLNADDDTEAGLPDLLGRSLRTSRRPDAFKIAVTTRALGTAGLGELVDRCCDTATEVARAVASHSRLRLWGEPTLSTILLRPRVADLSDDGDALVAAVRRGLLDDGAAVLGRATMPDIDGTPRLWLKLTLLHPHATPEHYLPLLDLVADKAERCR
ncbi:pyridoxal phosphate-dependent decarboxylase family protein [Actinokineospora globicatena]|uniref:pyridoxal phosphate-dependent decarboxylase family protein n=1 Tax=Actinokineospora globicatena TaxID=103729 RepID=UPI0020A5A3A6|nr:aminotransferase class V-fold PLP-dependent enzyme [Actinokineospora globicatena]MCP2302719.1 L-2,4-diaminobutyrate decarboxylase [Actinokineospora globicatena]GLW75592.1 aspartate aminotransferase family protein [Actinokineospora globicatena]GLW82432.1 aspartate aminotransferase family protein [Actinokineospora globicatena]